MGALGRIVKLAVAAAAIFCAIAALAGAALVKSNGTKGADRLEGTERGDLLKGLAGNDVLVAGDGRDVLIGGKGNDKLRGGPRRDGFNMRDGVELAAPGNDKIFARDGGNDEINCGAGEDVAIVDATEDGVIDCEVVREP